MRVATLEFLRIISVPFLKEFATRVWQKVKPFSLWRSNCQMPQAKIVIVFKTDNEIVCNI